jgi:3-hydroxybutyryl-CoA dehydratase
VGHKVTHQEIITEKLHQTFGELSGDLSPIHTDLRFCQANGYEKKIGYAFLITTLLSKIYGTIFPGGSELCLKQSCLFKNPYFVGDILNFELVVSHKNDSLKLLTLEIKDFNQNQKKIFDGQAEMLLTLKNP